MRGNLNDKNKKKERERRWSHARDSSISPPISLAPILLITTSPSVAAAIPFVFVFTGIPTLKELRLYKESVVIAIKVHALAT
jgi:hypothetical protein